MLLTVSSLIACDSNVTIPHRVYAPLPLDQNKHSLIRHGRIFTCKHMHENMCVVCIKKKKNSKLVWKSFLLQVFGTSIMMSESTDGNSADLNLTCTKRLARSLLALRARRQLVFSKVCLRGKVERERKKIDTISLHNPTGCRRGLGEGGGKLKRLQEVNR